MRFAVLHPIIVAALCCVALALLGPLILRRPVTAFEFITCALAAAGIAFFVVARIQSRRRREVEEMRDSALW